MKELILWTIYNKGKDPYPNNYIAWKFSIIDGSVRRTDEHMIAPRLEMIQDQMKKQGLIKIMPETGDDPSIIETWI